jgi:hypothetical protein
VAREPNPDDWAVVGVPVGASRRRARSAYLARAIDLHPDHHPDLDDADRGRLDRQMAALNEAWDRLEHWFDDLDASAREAGPFTRLPPPPDGIVVVRSRAFSAEETLRLVGRGDALLGLASGRWSKFRTLRCTDRLLSPAQLAAAVDGLPRLRCLDLDGTGLDDSALPPLRRLAGLCDLHLADTAVTDAGLPVVASLARLSSLSLAFTAVIDAGLEHLRGHRALAILNLRGTAVEGAGLDALATCPSLRLLSLPHIHRRHRHALAQRRPDLQFA